MLCNATGGGGIRVSAYQYYKRLQSNVISFTAGWGGGGQIS